MASAVLLEHPEKEWTLQPALIRAVTISAFPLVHATWERKKETWRQMRIKKQT